VTREGAVSQIIHRTKGALIDPKKKPDEDGQYQLFDLREMSLIDAVTFIATAQRENMEIRYYYRELRMQNGKEIPVKIVLTEIPPGHVQPFHTHEEINEVTIVEKGELVVCDSEDLTEENWSGIMEHGRIAGPGDLVREDLGVRHTVANRSQKEYCHIITVQTSRTRDPEKFATDWVRAKQEPGEESANAPTPSPASPNDVRGESTEEIGADIIPFFLSPRKKAGGVA